MRASPGPRHRSATAPVPGAPLSIPLKHSRGPPVYKRPARQTEKGARKKKKKKKKMLIYVGCQHSFTLHSNALPFVPWSVTATL